VPACVFVFHTWTALVGTFQGAYALIEFSEPACAKNALASSGEISLGGRRLTIKPRIVKTVSKITKSKNSSRPAEEQKLETKILCKGQASFDAHEENKMAQCLAASSNDKDLEGIECEDESLTGILKLCTSVSNWKLFNVFFMKRMQCLCL
jgi:hypothetical protein